MCKDWAAAELGEVYKPSIQEIEDILGWGFPQIAINQYKSILIRASSKFKSILRTNSEKDSIFFQTSRRVFLSPKLPGKVTIGNLLSRFSGQTTDNPGKI